MVNEGSDALSKIMKSSQADNGVYSFCLTWEREREREGDRERKKIGTHKVLDWPTKLS